MCMTAAVSLPGSFTIVAADTRFTLDFGARVEDWGGRLRRVGGAWVGATGNMGVLLLGLRRIDSYGAHNARRAVADSHAQVLRMACRPDRISESCFLIAHDAGTLEAIRTSELTVSESNSPGVIATGTPHRIVPPVYPLSQLPKIDMRFAWPPGMNAKLDAEGLAEFTTAVRRASGLADVVRAIAKAFMFGYKHGRDMSDEVEVGIMVGGRVGYLREVAAALAQQADIRFDEPPDVPAFPGLPAESRLFRVEENHAIR